MHNGGMKSLEEVVEFYARGADFFHANIQDLAPGVQGIPILQNNPEGIAAVVEFMKHLTDERVRIQAAPFDHPELLLPDGPAEVTTLAALDRVVVLPATGRNGGAPFTDFVTVLQNGLSLAPRHQFLHRQQILQLVANCPRNQPSRLLLLTCQPKYRWSTNQLLKNLLLKKQLL
jgi:hypothetical protein